MINAVLTPLLLRHEDPIAAAATDLFVARQGLSALAAILLLIAAASLWLGPRPQGGTHYRWSAPLAFLGSAALFAQEWGEVFIVNTLARSQPEALSMLENAPGIAMPDIAAMAALTLFSLGWIAVAIAHARGPARQRAAGVAVILGFFAIPILSALLGPALGAALGGAILGFGWARLGLDLRTGGASGRPASS